jgi:hypothetical protein
MPYATQYLQYVEAEIPVSRTLIRPRNIYRIKNYKDVEGKSHAYTGNNSAIVFVLGIADKKVWAVRMTDIRPVFFWNWMKPMFRPGLIVNDKIKRLEDMLIKDTRNGKKIFENFVKTKQIYSLKPEVFRTYELAGVNTISELKMDLNFLKSYFKLKSEEIDSEYDDPKVETNKTAKVKVEEQKLKDSNVNSKKADGVEGKETTPEPKPH